MTLFASDEKLLAESVSRLAYCNPFLPERIEYEKRALGEEFVDSGPFWHARPDRGRRPNVDRIGHLVDAQIESSLDRLAAGPPPAMEELRLYRDVAVYWLHDHYQQRFLELLTTRRSTKRVTFYREFAADCRRLLPANVGSAPGFDTAHLFACFFQVNRAFQLIFHHILGSSLPTAHLRAAVWQSIFTRDMKRYRRSIYARLGDVTTLVTGPSGTGKELVARAIGLARYVPFDTEREVFAEDFEASFFPLNLSALSPTLIESELFGHRKGAFTGAVADRIGWLESCPEHGSVFLDEIGEVDPAIQVKLLRVLQTRVFQPLGDTGDRVFEGKIIAATNRDPADEMHQGRMREDLYYRLCSDLIATPTLAAQLRDAPDELHNLVTLLSERIGGDEETEELANEVVRWIETNLGADYPWPGNVRELEQCVRNIMIRGSYHPPVRPSEPQAEMAAAIEAGTLTADELLRRYVTLVYARLGSYQGAARSLGLDRRTVKAKIDQKLLAELRGSAY